MTVVVTHSRCADHDPISKSACPGALLLPLYESSYRGASSCCTSPPMTRIS